MREKINPFWTKNYVKFRVQTLPKGEFPKKPYFEVLSEPALCVPTRTQGDARQKQRSDAEKQVGGIARQPVDRQQQQSKGGVLPPGPMSRQGVQTHAQPVEKLPSTGDAGRLKVGTANLSDQALRVGDFDGRFAQGAASTMRDRSRWAFQAENTSPMDMDAAGGRER